MLYHTPIFHMPYARTRSRGSTYVVPYTGFYQNTCSGATPVYSPGYTYIRRDPVVETIADELRAAGTSRRNYIGACTHSREEVNCPPIGSFTWVPDGSNCPGTNVLKRHITFPGDWCASFTAPSIPSPPGWESAGMWCDRQLRAIAEAAPTSVSLPNFLLELGDVKSLIPQIQKLGKTFDRDVTLRSLLKGGANAHLLAEFGIETLVRDVKKLLYAHERSVKRLLKLRKHNNTRRTVRRRRIGYSYISGTGVNSAGFPGLNSYVGIKRAPITAITTEVVGAQVFQSFSGLDSSLAELVVLRNDLGFNKPFSVIWEAVPFSWLVDYFVSIDYFIDQLPELEAFQGTPQLFKPWYSKKVEYSVQATFENGPYGTLDRATFPGRIAYSGKVKSYSRTGVIPSGYSPRLLSGSLSGDQITNLLAVLLQKGL